MISPFLSTFVCHLCQLFLHIDIKWLWPCDLYVFQSLLNAQFSIKIVINDSYLFSLSESAESFLLKVTFVLPSHWWCIRFCCVQPQLWKRVFLFCHFMHNGTVWPHSGCVLIWWAENTLVLITLFIWFIIVHKKEQTSLYFVLLSAACFLLLQWTLDSSAFFSLFKSA